MDFKRMFGGMLVAGAAIAAPFAVASPAGAATEHCAINDGAVKVEAEDGPATVVINGIEVEVTFDGASFTVEPTDDSVTLTYVEWCVKSATNTNGGNSEEGQPQQSESTNKKGKRQAISYVVISLEGETQTVS